MLTDCFWMWRGLAASCTVTIATWSELHGVRNGGRRQWLLGNSTVGVDDDERQSTSSAWNGVGGFSSSSFLIFFFPCSKARQKAATGCGTWRCDLRVLSLEAAGKTTVVLV
ncbi:hypothetical protein M0R45_031173 [Rubus argutus]|uniref:Secreted protein n=1 Tax=Rubus argutus TaxID=59490 RepID=A0AAW1WGQ7_RUBAR